MKLFVIVSGLCLAFIVFLFLLRVPSSSQKSITQEYVPNEVLVKFKPEAGKQKALTALDVLKPRVVNYLGQEIAFTDWNPEIRANRSFLGDPYLVLLRVPETIGTEKAIAILKNDPNAEYAEYNYICRIMEAIPNDPRFLNLWNLKNTGQTGEEPGADIKATYAWDIFTGSSDVVVAVIDTGIDYNHLDLQANIWTNQNEIPGNGIDDDGNGYDDDYLGWDFVEGNNDPMDSIEAESHGTHVAGIIGATGNNGEGVAGVCWTVKLMALKCGNGSPVFNYINAVDYATAANAGIINASWGMPVYSQSLFDAIRRARDKGVLFVAAAANYQYPVEWFDNDKQPVYPASYELENIIAVLATDYNDEIDTWSHYGKRSVDVGAPGGPIITSGICSTVLGGGYGYKSGTSMAAPHVAGAAALAIGKCLPITYSQLKSRLLAKVDILPSLSNKCVSSGRLNVYKLIHDTVAPSAPVDLTAVPTGWTTITLTFTDNSTNEIGFEVLRKLPGMPDYVNLKSADASVTPNGSIDDPTCMAGQTYSYKLRAYNMAGQSDFTNEASAAIPVGPPLAPRRLSVSWDWGRGAVDIAWTDTANNEQSYFVERISEWETQWTLIAMLGQNISSFYDTEAEGDTIFYYRIGASNPMGQAYSGIAQVYVPWHEESAMGYSGIAEKHSQAQSIASAVLMPKSRFSLIHSF